MSEAVGWRSEKLLGEDWRVGMRNPAGRRVATIESGY
jgi:hypothetical protein